MAVFVVTVMVVLRLSTQEKLERTLQARCKHTKGGAAVVVVVVPV